MRGPLKNLSFIPYIAHLARTIQTKLPNQVLYLTRIWDRRHTAVLFFTPPLKGKISIERKQGERRGDDVEEAQYLCIHRVLISNEIWDVVKSRLNCIIGRLELLLLFYCHDNW